MNLFLAIILVAVILLLAVHAWLGWGEDLSVYDHPVEEGGAESRATPGGPSPGHAGVVAALESKRPEIEALSPGALVRWVRRFMDEMPAGKRIDARIEQVDCDGVPCEWVLAPGADPARRVLYLHGGAFFAGSPLSHRAITSRFSSVARAAVLSVDYRLIPDNRRIDGIEDCRRAFRWLLDNGPEGPAPLSTLFLGGDSAGGNLALAVSAWSRDEGLRRPDAVVAFSPVTDSNYLAPSIRGNLDTDILVKPLSGSLVRVPRPLLRWVITGLNRMRPSNPLVSPVFGDLSGLPPTLVLVSESEMLFDDARRYVNKARKAGSPVRLLSWAGLLHAWPLFYPEIPEAGLAWERVAEFLKEAENTAD